MTETVMIDSKTFKRYKAKVCYLCGKPLEVGEIVVVIGKSRRMTLAHKSCWLKRFPIEVG